MTNESDRILIVGRNMAGAEELASFFSAAPYDVETCRGVTEAIQRIKDARFDCMIMDVKLPEMMGYEAVPIIKAIDPSLNIIMTTAENTKELEIKARQQDIFYYYISSFDRKELETAVRNVFEKVRRDRKRKQ